MCPLLEFHLDGGHVVQKKSVLIGARFFFNEDDGGIMEGCLRPTLGITRIYSIGRLKDVKFRLLFGEFLFSIAWVSCQRSFSPLCVHSYKATYEVDNIVT